MCFARYSCTTLADLWIMFSTGMKERSCRGKFVNSHSNSPFLWVSIFWISLPWNNKIINRSNNISRNLPLNNFSQNSCLSRLTNSPTWFGWEGSILQTGRQPAKSSSIYWYLEDLSNPKPFWLKNLMVFSSWTAFAIKTSASVSSNLRCLLPSCWPLASNAQTMYTISRILAPSAA